MYIYIYARARHNAGAKEEGVAKSDSWRWVGEVFWGSAQLRV